MVVDDGGRGGRGGGGGGGDVFEKGMDGCSFDETRLVVEVGRGEERCCGNGDNFEIFTGGFPGTTAEKTTEGKSKSFLFVSDDEASSSHDLSSWEICCSSNSSCSSLTTG